MPYPSWKHCRAAVVCGLLLLAVELVFGQTGRHGFVNYDDNKYVYDNSQVSRGLTQQGIVWAFTTGCANNWHPLTWLSHMLDCQLDGLCPGPHHMTSVWLHAANAILFFLILWRMTGDLWPSALLAAVFAIHPLRVESVAWVSERKDVLSGFFFLLTLAAYVGYAHRRFSLLRYLTVVLLFVLGLMAKPMVVTLPFVLLLLDYWPLGRWRTAATTGAASDRWGGSCTATPRATVQLSPQQISSRSFAIPWHLLVEKLPLLALAAASCVVTCLVQSKAIAAMDYIPISSRIANALVAYVAYAGQLFYPVGLAALYPHPGSSLPIWKIAGAFLALVCISTGALAARRRFPYLFVGWFWYLGMLVPVIGLLQVGKQAMADRYTYLPQIGLCLALIWGIAEATASWPYRRWVCGVASVLVVLGLMGCARQQTSYWRDSETLWNRTLDCTSNNFLAHNNLGIVLAARGQVDEAMAHYEKSLEINPDYAFAHNNLGQALAGRGQIDAAMAHYRKALESKPDFAEAHNNLGLALASHGQIDAAIAHFEQALEIKPDAAFIRNNLGLTLAIRGQFRAAIAQYEKALETKPDYDESLNNLAWLLATCPDGSLRNGVRAIELARRVNNLGEGKQAVALNTLAAAYAEAGRFPQAITTACQSLELAVLHKNRALADALRARIALYESGKSFHQPQAALAGGPQKP